MRKEIFANGEFYHVYNRGTDKRVIFNDQRDFARFFQSMREFNTIDPIGSIYEHSFLQLGNPTSKLEKSESLVNVIAYCLNRNHFHFLLEQVADEGISQFMKRLGGGYAKYYNERYKRVGTLFQGRFKAKHIATNEYLLHLSAYVNLNNRVHKLRLGNPTSKLKAWSSWEEYAANDKNGFCHRDIILKQFKNTKDYREFAESSLATTLERRKGEKELNDLLLE
ncbi:MAG: hypothetical protein A3D65_00875 [Candidatus Lloydbacteria bacterium RIFCSPHIGHO2_02_FULL_50_13]|uniref:Transposase IS200-like domain-containing protein n=1 Tax=Candidatus Lloydbacteria bacterium RIFCSPHIGHO2_02_FULL_50_13 TaxID=1798661 RepID=A0A1G2D239_9BACT|nr:MAG: hypothetical protein A3D65_00875 [Candidatus Lloydbacteria bacterium RIFCSPHIGHO2_02_FULL_50_13]